MGTPNPLFKIIFIGGYNPPPDWSIYWTNNPPAKKKKKKRKKRKKKKEGNHSDEHLRTKVSLKLCTMPDLVTVERQVKGNCIYHRI